MVPGFNEALTLLGERILKEKPGGFMPVHSPGNQLTCSHLQSIVISWHGREARDWHGYH